MNLKTIRDATLKGQKKGQIEKLKKDPENKEMKQYLVEVELELKRRKL